MLYRADQPIGTVALHDDGYVLATGTSIIVWGPDGSVRPLATVTGELPEHRFNDGALDPQGRFLAGTVGPTEDTPTGRLHRLEHDGTSTVLLDGLTLSNGIDFTADGRTMYLIDSPTRSVQVFDYGDTLIRRGSLAPTEGDDTPDGMCVDADEHLWVAYFEGHRVVRYTPDGAIDLVVQPPGQPGHQLLLRRRHARHALHLDRAGELLGAAPPRRAHSRQPLPSTNRPPGQTRTDLLDPRQDRETRRRSRVQAVMMRSPPPSCGGLVNTTSCHDLRGSADSADITCLMLVYSSNE